MKATKNANYYYASAAFAALLFWWFFLKKKSVSTYISACSSGLRSGSCVQNSTYLDGLIVQLAALSKLDVFGDNIALLRKIDALSAPELAYLSENYGLYVTQDFDSEPWHIVKQIKWLYFPFSGSDVQNRVVWKLAAV